ncbi:hypothetical protein [Paractinoplanes rishiriensis]|uniref:hypothetical protein n=1 Tax=Paractinoplanes rishiriensis TaxID=1050105 RepID=UPI0019414133|nr:hypothetical protein [Actinoplanes rishiriensis]
MSEPYVVRHDATTERLARLADVLITTADDPALFERYPGLALVVTVHDGRTIAVRSRDGTATFLRGEPGMPLRLTAVAVYHAWVAQHGGPR